MRLKKRTHAQSIPDHRQQVRPVLVSFFTAVVVYTSRAERAGARNWFVCRLSPAIPVRSVHLLLYIAQMYLKLSYDMSLRAVKYQYFCTAVSGLDLTRTWHDERGGPVSSLRSWLGVAGSRVVEKGHERVVFGCLNGRDRELLLLLLCIKRGDTLAGPLLLPSCSTNLLGLVCENKMKISTREKRQEFTSRVHNESNASYYFVHTSKYS